MFLPYQVEVHVEFKNYYSPPLLRKKDRKKFIVNSN